MFRRFYIPRNMKRMSCAPVAIKPPPVIVAGLLPSPLALPRNRSRLSSRRKAQWGEAAVLVVAVMEVQAVGRGRCRGGTAGPPKGGGRGCAHPGPRCPRPPDGPRIKRPWRGCCEHPHPELRHPELPHAEFLHPEHPHPELPHPELPHRELPHPEHPHPEHLHPELPHPEHRRAHRGPGRAGLWRAGHRVAAG